MVSSGNGAAAGSIAERWRELQGENSWNGLLDPLDMDLRRSLISYGELVAATGDGFNKEERSPHYGLCRYGHDDLLAKTGVAAAGQYRVTKFIYAWEDKKPTWIGYVAVATDEGVAALGRRDVVVAWRGSLTAAEWDVDKNIIPASAAPVLGSAAGKFQSAVVHGGFLGLYTNGDGGDDKIIKGSARDQATEEVRRLMELYKDNDQETSITVAGHSLGAALSILNAVDLVANGVNRSCPVTAVVFACPHFGNQDFKDAMDWFSKDLKALQVRNKEDPVPKVLDWLLPDLAVTLFIDTMLSPYLKDPINTVHELECYLHGVAGVQAGGGFELEVDRDVALLNKGADALKDEYPVPAIWWVPENKGMVKNDKGKWELKDFEQI